MNETNYTIKSHTQTFEEIAESLQNNEPLFYVRFGDGELFFMSGEIEGNKRHRNSKELQKELKAAFEIESSHYRIGCSIKGNFGSSKTKRQLEAVQLTDRKDMNFDSAVAFLVIYREDQRRFFDFCRETLWGKRVLLIGGPTVANNPLVKAMLGVTKAITITDTQAYYGLESHMDEIIDAAKESDIVIPCLGHGSKVLAGRLFPLWEQANSNSDNRYSFLDVGSIVDAMAGAHTRSWIKKLPKEHLLWYYTEVSKYKEIDNKGEII